MRENQELKLGEWNAALPGDGVVAGESDRAKLEAFGLELEESRIPDDVKVGR